MSSDTKTEHDLADHELTDSGLAGHGFVRVSAAVPKVSVGDPVANTTEMLSMLNDMTDADVVVFPELGVSAYSCGDLFHQSQLLSQTLAQIDRLAKEMPRAEQVIMVGAPIAVGNALYNCAVVINNHAIVGIVPKQFLPNYKEFYEARWFAPGDEDLPAAITVNGSSVPFGTGLLFTSATAVTGCDVVLFAEICEAIWMPIPPSSRAAIAGANIICNLSASNETVGKADYRRNLVTGQSGRCSAAYVYSSSGPTESTNDVVFGGHAIIAEAGGILVESTRVGDSFETERGSYFITTDVDVERLQSDRRVTTTFNEQKRYINRDEYRHIAITLNNRNTALKRQVDAMPFVPKDQSSLDQRCSEVFGIQTASLAKRLECLGPKPQLTIGISGGLDSTLALLVATRTCDMLGLPRSVIRGVTMPGFGTTDHTLKNARELMDYLGVTVTEIDIREAVLLEFKELSVAMGYKAFGQVTLTDDMDVKTFVELISKVPVAERQDLVFENAQARRRTELLMNMGFVLGTGDMSEMWLGWCTYNADHQSMYNVNCSVPKTLVKFLVRYIANTQFESPVRETLLSVADTEISPELLPPDENGNIAQSTEDTVGPYEIHDFFMYHFMRFGFSPEKILYLASFAEGWSTDYTEETLRHWLRVNIKRAFAQQYKRDDVPNGPKVGSVSLSPRGDWRMPSDASASAWVSSL